MVSQIMNVASMIKKKLRLECGHELHVIDALCRSKMGKSVPVVQGVLNGKFVTVLWDTHCSSARSGKNL